MKAKWPEPKSKNQDFNEAIDLCFAAHIAVLESLKYEINYADHRIVVKNNWLREFNARIQEAIEKAREHEKPMA
jgi:hypothetical protein